MFACISRRLQCDAAAGKALLHHYSTAAAVASRNSILEECLTTSLGFSKDEAASALLKVTLRLKPVENDPHLVVNFFQSTGLDKSQIKFFISARPYLLLSDVEKTLKPKIEFWRDALGSDEKLVRALKRWRFLLDNHALKNFTRLVPALREIGFCDEAIARLVVDNLRALIVLTPERVVEIADRVENQLGIRRTSAMFYHGFWVLSSTKESTIDLKKAVFRSFGWSDSEMAQLFMKFPMVLRISEARLRESLEFYMGELGYTADFLASHHTFLVVGLDTRAKPRNEVLKMLISKNLRKTCLYTLVCLPEKKFMEQFLIPFKDQIPDTYESYVKTLQKVKKIEIS